MDWLTRAMAIRPGEGRLVMLVAGAFAAVEAGRGLGEVGVDTLVLSRSGADILPYLYIGLGLVGLIVTLSYGAALTRSTSQRFFPGLLVVLGAILAAEWLIALSGVEAVFPLVWISVYAAGLLLLTAMWTVGGFTFDARQAKRLFPLLTSAAIVGSLAGFLSAIVVQRIVGAEFLILAEALLFLVAAGLLSGLGSRVKPRHAAGATPPSAREALTTGASYVAGSPLMRLVAIAYVLLAILMFSLTFPFMSAMSEAYQKESELLTVLALFSAAVTVTSFLIGTLLANRLYARLGVATVAMALPLMYLLGFGLWIVRFTLTTAIIVRFAQQVTQRGLSNAAFSAFYSVIPSARRGQVLAFMDGVPGQLGTVLSGVLLIIASSLAMEQVFWLGLVTAIICLAVLYLIRRAYASSLVTTLREGRAEQVLEGGPGLEAMASDSSVIAELLAATRSEQATERLLAADLLGRLAEASAADDLRRLAEDEDPEVRRAALASLVRVDPAGADDALRGGLGDDEARVRAAALIAAADVQPTPFESADLTPLEDDPDATVRCELAVFSAGVGDVDRARRLVETMVGSDASLDRAEGLDAAARIGPELGAQLPTALADDPDAAVRAAALRALAVYEEASIERSVAALDDPALEVRDAAVHVLRERPDASDRLLQVLEGSSYQACEGALSALAPRAEEVREDLLTWAEARVTRATELRRHVGALSTADPLTTAGYLGDVIAARGTAIEGLMLQALAILGAPEASGLIRRCLSAPDPEVRAQAIEALDALGEPRLTRGVVRLLEGDATPTSEQPVDIIVAADALAEDPDPWVRALALRTLAEHLVASQHRLALRVQEDPDPLIHATVEVKEEAEPMPEALQLVSDVDRMLVLRRVPLFASLAPEDLQRVAAAAVEHSWADGDVLMAEGDVGDELVVIVEGGVHVVHIDGDVERQIRTYGEGDHIGELAVLREAPRAATVVADEHGVRGLVISGEAIHALLRERPDAAMAMLATLAERISQQT